MSYLKHLSSQGPKQVSQCSDFTALRETTVQRENSVRESKVIPKLFHHRLQHHLPVVWRLLHAGGKGNSENVLILLLETWRCLLVSEAPYEDHKWLVGTLASIAYHFTWSLP